MCCMATNTEISRTAAGKLMRNKIKLSEYAAKLVDARRQQTRRCLQTVMHPPTYVLPSTGIQAGNKAVQMVTSYRRLMPDDGIVSAVNLASTQSVCRFDDRKVQRPQGGQSLDPLAPALANCGPVRQKKGDIASKL